VVLKKFEKFGKGGGSLENFSLNFLIPIRVDFGGQEEVPGN